MSRIDTNRKRISLGLPPLEEVTIDLSNPDLVVREAIDLLRSIQTNFERGSLKATRCRQMADRLESLL